MIQALCVQKFRDNNGAITGYRLVDNQGSFKDIAPDVVKAAMNQKKLVVFNLTLTSDGRLVDAPEPVSQEAIQSTGSNTSIKSGTAFIKNGISAPTGAKPVNKQLNALSAYAEQVLTCVKNMAQFGVFDSLKKMYAKAREVEQKTGNEVDYADGNLHIQKLLSSFPGGKDIKYCNHDLVYGHDTPKDDLNFYTLIFDWASIQDYKEPSWHKIHRSSAWLVAYVQDDNVIVDSYVYGVPSGWGSDRFLTRTSRLGIQTAVRGVTIDVNANDIKLDPVYLGSWLLRLEDFERLMNFEQFEFKFYQYCNNLLSRK